jgi:tetratricopeptide (TPR) repeat protein
MRHWPSCCFTSEFPSPRGASSSRRVAPQNRTAPPRIARAWWYGQQYDSALTAMARYGEFPDEHGLVLGYLGRAQAGLAYVDSVKQSSRALTDMASARAVLLARLGRRAESEAAIRQAMTGESTSHFHHAAFNIASAYALMGRSDDALRWLERTASDGMPAYSLFANDPTLASLRTDPRFVKFLAAERERHERLTAIVAGGR